jgi:hypothetical protein
MADLFQPSAAELRDRFLRDARLAAIDAGGDEPPTEPGSDWYILGTAVAGPMLLGFANINASEQAWDVLNAVSEDLDAIRVGYGLPEISPSGSRGKIRLTIAGPTTIPANTPLVLPSGLSARTTTTVTNPSDGQEIDVESVDTGSKTNLGAGKIVRFNPPPTNVAEEATVSTTEPLVGGDDGESDPRKRDRILNALRNRPAGGNWGQLRGWALEAGGFVQDGYVYPALGGPGSSKTVAIRQFDIELGDFSRAPTAAQVQAVRVYIQTKMGIPQENVIQTVADEDLDVALEVTIPESALAGGNGQGWTDPTPWPPLVPGDSGRVTISAIPADNQITVTAITGTAPVAGQTHVAWWSSVDRKFRTRLVTATSATAPWVLTLESPLLDDTGAGPAIGDFVCPAALNLESYGDAWVALIGRFGPGEMTAEAARLDRAKRHPFVTDEDPTGVTNSTIAQWSRGYEASGSAPAHAGFPEITAFDLAYANKTTPSIPTTIDDPPNVLRPRRFAVYKLT